LDFRAGRAPSVRKGFGEGEKAKGLLAGMLEGQAAFLA
jgi:hypothetical protein